VRSPVTLRFVHPFVQGWPQPGQAPGAPLGSRPLAGRAGEGSWWVGTRVQQPDTEPAAHAINGLGACSTPDAGTSGRNQEIPPSNRGPGLVECRVLPRIPTCFFVSGLR